MSASQSAMLRVDSRRDVVLGDPIPATAEPTAAMTAAAETLRTVMLATSGEAERNAKGGRAGLAAALAPPREGVLWPLDVGS